MLCSDLSVYSIKTGSMDDIEFNEVFASIKESLEYDYDYDYFTLTISDEIRNRVYLTVLPNDYKDFYINSEDLINMDITELVDCGLSVGEARRAKDGAERELSELTTNLSKIARKFGFRLQR